MKLIYMYAYIFAIISLTIFLFKKITLLLKAPTSDTPRPTISPKPSKAPTLDPTPSPTLSFAPTLAPVITASPSEQLFQVITTRCYCRSPFRGISQTDLTNRFNAIVELLRSVMQQLLGPERANWGTRVVRVGSINARRLSTVEIARLLQDAGDEVEVEYEFTNSRECYNDDGCNDAEQEAAVQEGLGVLATVETVVASGQLQQTIVEEAPQAGLTEELGSVEVASVVVSTPQVELIDITAYPSIEKTPAPIAPTSSPTYDCEDSPFRFMVEKDGKMINRSCWWVRTKRNSRCRLPGVREMCPQSCWRCRNCADSTLRFKFEFNGNEDFRSCEWVARKDTAYRCIAVEGVSDTCPLTCGTCERSTGSPSTPPSESLSSLPSSAPTRKTTGSPTSSTPAPTVSPECSDSPLRFRVRKGGALINRYCEWVAAVPSRCSLEGISTACPQTCGTCNTCVDSSLSFKLSLDDDNYVTCAASLCNTEGVPETCRDTCGSCCSDVTGPFKFSYNGNTINRSCEWAGRKDTVTRCAVSEVSEKCPVTCGVTCGGGGGGGCSDVTGMFEFPYNGKTINRSCEWAGRKDTVTRCAVSEVSQNCPVTCGTCSD